MASEEPEILEIPRKIPPWAIAVIIVLNSVIIILVLLLVLGVVWKRYSRLLYYKIVTGDITGHNIMPYMGLSEI